MSKPVSLAACIAKMYEGGRRDSAGSSGAGTPVKKPNSSVINNLSSMDIKLNLLDAKVEKIVNSQGEVLKKLDVVYQGIGDLGKDMARLKLSNEPSIAEENTKKCDSAPFSEIKALCSESVKLLKSLQQDSKKQKEKIDGIELSFSVVDKVIKFVSETFKRSEIVEYILRGTVPWRKDSLLESNEEKPDKTEERGAKPKARFCNRAIQAETRISLEDDRGKEKALSKPVERANIDCTTPTQTPCQAVKDSTSLGAQATNQTSGPENADDVHPLPVLDKPSIYNSGNKPSCKLKEVSNQKREPIQTQTLIKDTQNIGLNTEDQYGTEEAEGGHICAVAGGSERDVSAATENGRHKSAATALERILDTPEGSPDTGLQILEASDDETLQASPFSVQPQQPAVEDKKKKKNTRERRKSSKSSVPLPKHKEAECKPHVKVVVAVQKTVSPAKQQEEQNAPQAFSASGLQKDNSTTIEIKAEKLPSQPQSEPMQLLPAGTHQTEPDKLGEKLGEKPEAADNTEIQANKETTGTNPPAVAKSPEPQLVVIDDSPPLPAPFEHRIVSAKQLPVNSYYTVKQNEVLGGGRFGQVLKCAELSSGLTLAAKIIKVKGSKDREEVKNEIGVMNQLNHVNLIQLYDAFESRNNLTLIMEYVEGGELFDRIIDENYQLTELDAIVFTRQICEGVQYLHQQYILHLDLKPENILCVNHTGNQIKIIDFGLARKYKPREKLKVNFGTPEFLAPEVVNYDYVSFPTDMWSVGVITYMLLSGLSPFLGDNDTETMNNILHSNWEFDVDAFENVSAEAKDFISRLLIPERCSRLSASGCMKHDWLNNLADKAKMRRVRLKSQLRLQSYLAHRQWKKHFYVIAAANRLKRFRQGRSVNPA